MSKQYNKLEKRHRRNSYIKRKKIAVKAKSAKGGTKAEAPAASA